MSDVGGSLNFGPVTDPDAGDTVKTTYTITPNSWIDYFTFDPLTGVLEVNNKIGLLSSNTNF